ncbi:unnamed protein product [Peniophora sp. CBMAI 1063]|nr:unnamed protein product [Peniophora sp. CBMAI 1063]
MRSATLAILAALVVSAVGTPVREDGLKIPLSSRKRFTNTKGVADISRLQGHLSRSLDKVSRGLDAFERNTGNKHPLDSGNRRPSRRATGGDPLTDDDDGSLWQGPISVGSPAKGFTVDFDTGSSDLFLPGVDCLLTCLGHTLYNPGASRVSTNTRQRFSLAFGDGSTVQGTVFTDTVTVAGLSATGQAVGESSQYSTGFEKQNFPPDGLMGMGFQQISVFNEPPFFQTLVNQGTVTSPEFGVKLSTSGSELFLGGADTSLFTGSLTSVPVTTVGFWQVTMDSINAAGKAAGSNLDSIIDTGTTLVIGDMNTVAALYAEIPGSADASETAGPGFFTFPCDTDPEVSLTFGGKSFPISLDTFNLGLLTEGGDDCVGGVMGASGLPADFIVGDVFLQNVYTVFNVGNTTVSFADLA